jgi:hypothetical protein
MSFNDDINDADYRRDPYFYRPPMRIVITTFVGEHVQTIDLPELSMTRDECNPAWLALHEAERNDADERGVE